MRLKTLLLLGANIRENGQYPPLEHPNELPLVTRDPSTGRVTMPDAVLYTIRDAISRAPVYAKRGMIDALVDQERRQAASFPQDQQRSPSVYE